MTNYTNITSMDVTTASTTVTVNSAEAITQYKVGDLIFVDAHNPLIIASIASNIITLQFAATFTATATTGVIISSNVVLRDALTTIETNNAAWGLHFSPFLTWVSTADAQSTMYDSLGNAILVYTASGLNALANNIITADVQLDGIELRVTNVETDLTTIEGTLDAKVSAASLSETNAGNSETAAQSAQTAAELALDNFDDRYLGAKATNPTLDNDGQALLVGASYWNSVSNELRYWTGGSWAIPEDVATQAASSATASSLLAQDWANKPTEVTAGNESAKTYAGQASADVVLTHADVVLTGNDVGSTNADVVLTHADVVLTHADVVLTGNDLTDTNADVVLTNADVVLAEDAKNIALANANFKGEWSALVGVLNIPASVKHLDIIYMLNVNLADVTLSEPTGINTDWFVLGSVTGVAPDSDRLGGELPAFYALESTTTAHTGNTSNPHSVTQAQVGLGAATNLSAVDIRAGTTQTDVGLSNVNNTNDLDKPVSTATQTALDLKSNLVTTTADIAKVKIFALAGMVM